jgi:hypothetical protein
MGIRVHFVSELSNEISKCILGIFQHCAFYKHARILKLNTDVNFTDAS